MRGTLTKTMRAVLALLIAGCLLFGMCGTVLATSDEALTGDIVDLLKEMENLLAEYGPQVLEEMYTYYDGDTQELKKLAKELVATLEEKLGAFAAEHRDTINATIDKVEADLKDRKVAMQGMLDDLKAEMEAMEALLATAEGEEAAAIQAEIDAINADIQKYQDAFDTAVEVAETKIAQLRADLGDVFKDLDDLWETAKTLKKAIEAVEGFDASYYKDAIKTGAEALKAAMKAVYQQVLAIKEGSVGADAAVENCIQAMDDLVKAAAAHINEVYDGNTNILFKIQEKLEKLEAPVAGMDACIANAQKALEDLIQYREDSAKALYHEAQEKVANLAKSLSDLYEPIKAKIKEYVEKFLAAYEGATTDDYYIGKAAYYVAIGDNSIYGSSEYDSYVERLAETIGVPCNKLKSLNPKTARDLIKEKASEIEKADLITVGFSSTDLMMNALKDRNKGVKLDWEPYLGAKGAAELQKILVKVRAKLAEQELEDLLGEIVELYAYNCMTYAVHLPALVDEIRAMNPDAVVVIVGMYNELKGVEMTFKGETTALGNYFQHLVKSASMYGLIYAMLTSRAIFVEVEDAKTVNEQTNMDPVDVIFAYGAGDMYPNDQGYEYMTNEILDALRITRTGLLGDVNLDGQVDQSDVTMLFAYVLGEIPELNGQQMLNADVNGDYGRVDQSDVTKLFAYVLGELPTLE